MRPAGIEAGRPRWSRTTDIPGLGRFTEAAFLLTALLIGGVGAFHVKLHAPPFVVRGGSAVLRCNHSVDRALLHKVEWLKDGDRKLFQFVRGRNPPYRNFSIPGATLDWSRSNEREIRLTGLELEASGVYSCEVSMETPIYTKPSHDERLVVIQRQAQDPEVWGRKPSYVVGENLEVNCTSAPSHPPAHITWLVNGRQVSEKSLRWFTGHRPHLHRRKHGHHHHQHHNRRSGGMNRGHHHRNQHRVHSEEEVNDEMGNADDLDMGLYPEPAALPALSLAPSSSTVQLTFYISEESALEGVTEGENEVTSQANEENTIVNGRIAITCLATIPAFLGSGTKIHEYADHRLTSIDVDVLVPAKVSPVKEEPIMEESVEVLLFSTAGGHAISLHPTFIMVQPFAAAFLSSLFTAFHTSSFFLNPNRQIQSHVLGHSRTPNHACPCR